MKVTLIAALTADGFIGRSPHHISTAWTSKEDKDFFIATTKKIGTVIMGSTTYETFKKPFKDRRHIVLSRTKQYEGVEVTNEPPRELLSRLEKEGVGEVALCGGSSIYTAFLQDGLVTKLYLTVEGVLFGSGVRFLSEELDIKMSLVSSTTLGESTVLLEYDVIA